MGALWGHPKVRRSRRRAREEVGFDEEAFKEDFGEERRASEDGFGVEERAFEEEM